MCEKLRLHREKYHDCKWIESCDCTKSVRRSSTTKICENCGFYKPIDCAYGWCKGLPEPVVVAWCKDICSLFVW